MRITLTSWTVCASTGPSIRTEVDGGGLGNEEGQPYLESMHPWRGV
jgi:hypothetical protein